MKKTIFAIIIAAGATLAMAHSGGKDANGCHTDSRTGFYHCH